MSSVTGHAHGIAAFQSAWRSAAEKTARTPSDDRAAAKSIFADARMRVRAPDDHHEGGAHRRHVVDVGAAPGEERLVLPALDGRADVRRPFLGRAHEALPIAPAAALHRGDDVVVAGAAAEVALEPLADSSLARRAAFLDQRDGRHDHPRRAVAALERVMVVERLLHGMELAVRGEPLDGRDLGPVDLDAEQGARLRGHAVDEDGACAARRGVAPDVRPRQPEPVAEDVDEQLARLELELVAGPVHGQRNASHGRTSFVAGSPRSEPSASTPAESAPGSSRLAS